MTISVKLLRASDTRHNATFSLNQSLQLAITKIPTRKQLIAISSDLFKRVQSDEKMYSPSRFDE